MSARGGEKRRRRRDRQFVELHEAISTRAATVAIVATCVLLAFQAARTLLIKG